MAQLLNKTVASPGPLAGGGVKLPNLLTVAGDWISIDQWQSCQPHALKQLANRFGSAAVAQGSPAGGI